MGKTFDHISQAHQDFITDQKIFFVGTAMKDGLVNVSPKGMDTLRVLGKNKIAWLNLTGSGNETAAHLLDSDRMTIMFCAFEGNPLILRLYGQAQAYHIRDVAFAEYIGLFPEYRGARQIILLDVAMVQTSCGFGVPEMEYQNGRTALTKWAQNKGESGIKNYWEQRNAKSLDGRDTGITR